MAAVTAGIHTPLTTDKSTYVTGAFTPAAGDLLVAFVLATGDVLDVTGGLPSLTGSLGMTFTRVPTRAVKASSADSLYLFVGNQPAVNASQTVTFDTTGDAATGAIIAVARVSGMTRMGNSGAVRQSAKQDNGASAGTPQPAFGAAALTGNPIIGCVGLATSTANKIVHPSGWSEKSDVAGYSTPTTGLEYAAIDSGFTGTTVTWGGTAPSAFCASIVELDTTAPVGPPDLILPPRIPPSSELAL